MCLLVSQDEVKWEEKYYAYSIIDGECLWK